MIHAMIRRRDVWPSIFFRANFQQRVVGRVRRSSSRFDICRV